MFDATRSALADDATTTFLRDAERALGAVDVRRAAAGYRARDELAYLPDALPPAVTAALAAEAEALRPHARRRHIPRYKKSGSVGHHVLRARAPAARALYESAALRALVSQLAGRPVVRCPDADPHATALYYYTEPGDHIGFHYDRSHYRGARYTVLLGVIDRSRARLECVLRRGSRAPETLRLATTPGTLVVFNGDRLYHGVSPVGEGETRVVLSMEFVTDPSMGALRRLVSDVKDAVAYFGFRGVFGRRG